MRELEAQDAAERAAGLPPSQRMRALVPDAGRFLYMLVCAGEHRRILELGTSHGYSTLWLASAAQAIGGHVTTVELMPERAASARANIARSGLGAHVTQHEGDGKQLVRQLPGPFDFVFIDAEKDDYEEFLNLTLDKVAEGGIIVADNVLSHTDQLGHYVEKAQHTRGLLSVTVNVGRGEEMSLRTDQTLPPETVMTLARLEVYARSNPQRSLAVPRDAGKFLHILAVAGKAQSALELGASTGYSGVWLGSALSRTGGRLLTVDPDLEKVKMARESFETAHLAQHVSVVQGKALDVLQTLEGPFDIAFLDAIKEEYLAYAEALWPKMRAGGLLIADNIDNQADVLAAYACAMQARPDSISATLHIGNGMEMTMKLG